MRIGSGPFRPRWFQPVLIFWVLTGLPIALVAPIVWITGASFTGEPPPPPQLGSGAWILASAIQLAVFGWVFVTPFALGWAELRYRKAIRALDLNDA